MPTLLRIDCSPRLEQSHSRQLADFIESRWKTLHPDGHVIYRDLAWKPVPHLSNETIAGFQCSPENMTDQLKAATAVSDELIAELKNATEVIISSPLYNLSTPSVLKAYIDQIVRSGHTFAVRDDGSYQGLLAGRKVHLALVMGASSTRFPDFQQNYLKAVLNIIGLEVANVFRLEDTSNPEAVTKNLPLIHHQITKQFSA